jgi:hypothetical protein
MASFFSSGKGSGTPAATALRIQTSLEGKARPIGWGANRLSPNLIGYNDFKGVARSQGGGKGGGGGGNGKGSSGGSYDYSAAVILGMCEGPVSSWGVLFNNGAAVAYSTLNLTTFNGDYSQTAWGYTSSNHPADARNYRGLAYMAAGPMPLGSSPNLPPISVEVVFGTYTDGVSGTPDANPATVITDFLTSDDFGSGFPAARLGDLTVYRNYARSIGLVVSPVIIDQAEARQFIKDLLEATNSEAVWSGGKLNIVPLGDIPTSGNGATYTPPSIAQYSLSDIDFKPLQGGNTNSKAGSSSAGPVAITRTDDPALQLNSWPVEYLERSKAYNPTLVTAQDDAAIATYGLRVAPKKTLHFFCASFAATMSAELAKGRAQPRASYAFTLGAEYILLDPTDIVELVEPTLGLANKWVRITEITENGDDTLTFQAEEYLAGTGGAPAHSMQVGAGFSANYNAQPTAPFSTVIWEPSYTLTGGLEIWIAASGGADFGGASIYASTDNSTFALIGQLAGPSRIGKLTASLATNAISVPGPTIDLTHTLSVDMSPSGEMLVAGSNADAANGNTLCFLASGGANAGEYLAYAGAALGTGQTYALTHLNRGLFETVPEAHSINAAFVRLIPDTFFRWTLTPDRIGQTVYIKVLPFNPYGGGQIDISSVTSVAYPVVGTAFANIAAGSVSIRDATNTQWLPIGTYDATTGTFSATTATTINATAITGTINANQIGSINATTITGTITAGQIGSVNASAITGAVTASQIGSVNATAITGTITAGQIATVAAGQVTGTLTAGQIGGVNVGVLVGGIAATQITSLTAGQVTGTLTAGQIGSVNAVNVVGTLTAGQIGSIGAAQITGTLVSGQIGSVGAIQITGSLTDSQIAALSGIKVSGTLTSAILPAGNILGTLTAGQIGGVNVGVLVGTLTAGQIGGVNVSSLIGGITAGQITSVNASAVTGTLTAGQIGSVNAGAIAAVNAAAVTGTLSAGQIGSVNASAITGGITAGQISSVTAASITGTVVTSQIGTLQVTGANIAGGSISASKFTVTGGNMVLDGAFADTAYWTFNAASAGWYLDTGGLSLGIAPCAGLYGALFTGSGYSQFFTPVNGASSMSVVPGTAYTLSATGYNSGNKDINVAAEFWNAAGAFLSAATVVWVAGASAVTTKRVQITAPAGAATIQVVGEVHAGAAWSGNAGIGGISVVQASTGEMIVDGSLTAAKLSAGFALISSAQIGNLNVDTINVKSGAVSYFAAEYNEYVWTPASTYGADGSCTVSITVADANEMVLIMFKTVAEYTDHATGVVSGSTGGGGAGTNGSELGGSG